MRYLTLTALSVALLAPGATAAEPPKTNPFDIPFEKYTLPNGLEVILHRDPSLPLVAVNVWYHVGPSNEPPGRSGFAHLFEHLMFEGSKHVGHEFDHLLESVGATNVNGTTSWDRTNYFETVPRQDLELALWLESDRMGYLVDALTPDRLEVQRDVVKNERRQHYENSPYGKSELAMYEALFPPDHPYHGAVIGSMEDLSRASMDDVKAFYRSFYAASNATLTLAGDFDPTAARPWIEKYFGGLPKLDRPVTARRSTPPITAPIDKNVQEAVELPRVAMGWLTPPAYTPDDTVLDVVATLLAGGKATRLYQDLVVKQKVASEVSTELDSNYLASMFDVDAMVAAGKDPKQVATAIDQGIADLAKNGPTKAELDRAKHRIVLHILDDLQRLDGEGGESGRAGTLQRFNHYLGDPGRLSGYVSRVKGVSADDVKRVVHQYLAPNARVTITTVPEAGKDSAGGTP
jgi:zinc protease